MLKITIKSQDDSEINKIISKISSVLDIKKKSKVYKQGKQYRIYVDIEQS